MVPKQHAETLLDLDQGQAQAVMVRAWQVARLLTTRLDRDAYNIVQSSGAAAWQEVPHMHVHVIPRYQGDDLRQPWLGRALEPKQAAALVQRLR